MTGGGFIAIVAELKSAYNMDVIWLNLSFPLAGCGVAAATVVAWFHGERGKQQSNVLEWILLSIIGVIWLTLTASMLIT